MFLLILQQISGKFSSAARCGPVDHFLNMFCSDHTGVSKCRKIHQTVPFADIIHQIFQMLRDQCFIRLLSSRRKLHRIFQSESCHPAADQDLGPVRQ